MPVKAFVNLIEFHPEAVNCFYFTPAEGGKLITGSFTEVSEDLASRIERQILILGIQKGIRITVSVDEK